MDCQIYDASQQDRCEWHLSNWSAWMRAGGVNLWYPSRASGGMGRSGSTDFDAMCANADTTSARAVDALIEGLPQAEKLTIHNEWLSTVFRVRGDPAELYASAKERIAKGLAAKGIW